jgi:hypothetical protein
MYWVFTLVIGMMIGQEVEMPLVRPIVVNGFYKLRNLLTTLPRKDTVVPEQDNKKTTVTEIVKNTIEWWESFREREKKD